MAHILIKLVNLGVLWNRVQSLYTCGVVPRPLCTVRQSHYTYGPLSSINTDNGPMINSSQHTLVFVFVRWMCFVQHGCVCDMT